MNFFTFLQASFFNSLESLRAISFLNNTFDQVLLAVLILALGWAIARLFTYVLGRYVVKLTRKTSNEIDDFSLNAFKNLGNFVIFIVSFFYATRVLTLTLQTDRFIEQILLVVVAIRVTAAAMKIFDFISGRYIAPYAAKNNLMDKTMVPTINRIVKMVAWSIVVLMIVSNLGYNISSLLAGLGIGGLAVALAAQDALSNFFGSISLFADKTFKVGDFVQTKDFQGTVKYVGLRSTRLDTLEGTEMIVPNSQLASSIVENLSRRPKRRVDLNFSLVYETSNTKLKQAIKILQTVVKKNKETDDHCRVHFKAFADYGLNIILTYWILDPDLEKGQLVQNEINLKIKEAFEKANICFAYPTQLLYLKNSKKTSSR